MQWLWNLSDIIIIIYLCDKKLVSHALLSNLVVTVETRMPNVEAALKTEEEQQVK